MVEVYISWTKGLPEHKEALAMIKMHDIISGVETLNKEEGCVENIHAAGVKVSVHNPCNVIDTDLSDNDFIDIMKKNTDMIKVVQDSDAMVAGFHAWPRSYWIRKKILRGESWEDIRNDVFDSKQNLVDTTVKNLLLLEEMINKDLSVKKKIIFETAPIYTCEVMGIPDKELGKKEQAVIKLTEYTASPGFIKDVLKGVKHNVNIGVLFDLGHVFVSGVTMILNGLYYGTPEDFVDEWVKACNGKIFELHLACPEGDDNTGYMDAPNLMHPAFKPGDEITNRMINIIKKVINASPNLLVVDFEIDTGLEPVEHVNILIEQTEYMVKELGLDVEK